MTNAGLAGVTLTLRTCSRVFDREKIAVERADEGVLVEWNDGGVTEPGVATPNRRLDATLGGNRRGPSGR